MERKHGEAIMNQDEVPKNAFSWIEGLQHAASLKLGIPAAAVALAEWQDIHMHTSLAGSR